MELKRANDASESPYELAADWLQRLDDPELSQEDLQAWLEWFEAADDHRKAFEELQTMRQRFRVLPPRDREELKRRVEPPVRRRRFANVWPLAAAIGAMAVGAGWWIAQTHGTNTYAAAENRHRTIMLDDGSSLVLGANSVVDVTYSPTRRFLNIQRGEAYFEVAHNRFRPFMVQAGEVRVTAVGTAFNVQRRSDQVTVTVTEGKVRVTRGDESPRATTTVSSGTTRTIETERVLAMGQQAVLPIATTAETPPAATVAPDWSGDHARFIDTPLRDVLPIINRHASTRLSIEDPRVADLTYSGTIFRSHVDEWITSLPQVFPVRAVTLQDGSVTLVSRERGAEP
ncbi:FecR family protein [Steroidobacter flavus]|uniref:FecR family protein n=1 Tax=Steroidobacter flavus TaxID=1842136 RepID=A0ABV8T0F5_9GAMM